MAPRPPRLAVMLLRRVVRPELHSEILGDLLESFRRQAANEGVARARLAFWREALSPSLWRLRRASAGLPPATGAPVDSRSGDPWMNLFARDLRFAMRVLGKSPGFSAVAILSIALGIGPNTAVFSILNGIMLQGEQAGQPERVVQVFPISSSGSYTATSYRRFEIVAEGTTEVFDGMTAFTNLTVRLGDGGDRLALGEMVTGNYFDILGIEPALGRGFLPEEDVTPGTHSVVVLSNTLWQSEFGGDPGTVGSEVRLNGQPYTIVGIAPESYMGRFPGLATDLWVPLMTYPHLNPGQMRSGNLWMVGRVTDGIPVERAVAAVSALAARVDEERQASGITNQRFQMEAWPITDFWFQPDIDRPIFAMAGLLLVAVILVLLIACTNLAGFLLARATDRRREMAVRAAMGASRGSIVRQLLVESLVLSVLGGALGLVLGVMVVRAVEGFEPPIGFPLNLDLGLDLRVLLFTAGATLLAGLFFGLAPSVRASRAPVASTLRDESAGAGQSKGKLRSRSLLVGAQVALSLVLLISAGLFVRSLQAALRLDPGFDTGPAGVVTVNATASGVDGEDVPQLIEDLLAGSARLPGVDAVAMTTRMPLELGTRVRFLDVPGVAPPEGADAHRLELAVVNEGYFDAMDIGLLQGRGFSTADVADAPPVTVLSEAAARRFWPGEDPIGKVMYLAGDPSVEYRVVGIAANVKIWSLTEADRPYMYRPLTQSPAGDVNVIARGSLPPGELARSLREMVRGLHPELFVPAVKTMEEHLSFILFLPRMGAVLMSAFGLLALTLASVGLYGLVGYGVSRRTREMGIRMSLGADRGDVLRLAMRSGLLLVLVGGGVGLGVAALGASALDGLLIGIAGLDPVTFLSVPLILGLIAVLAAYLPARRATRVNPVDALRAD